MPDGVGRRSNDGGQRRAYLLNGVVEVHVIYDFNEETFLELQIWRVRIL